MNARGIGEEVTGSDSNGLYDLRCQRGRCVVVEVDTHRERFILTFPLNIGGKRTRQAFRWFLYLQRLRALAQQADTLTPPVTGQAEVYMWKRDEAVRPASGQPA